MVKIRKFMNRRLALPVFILSLILVLPPSGWAANVSSNQAINQPASLVAPDAATKIALYLRPGRTKVGYGVNGDAVTVLEQVSDNQSMTWSHIRFDNPPYAEGWVQETFLSLKSATGSQKQSQQRRPSGNRYLGAQPRGVQSYSQQNQN